jgi:hypothetical protein
MMAVEHPQRKECSDEFKKNDDAHGMIWEALNKKVPYWMFCGILSVGVGFGAWITLAHFGQQATVGDSAASVRFLYESQKVQDSLINEHQARLVVAEKAIAVQDERWKEITSSLADIKSALGLVKSGPHTMAPIDPDSVDIR